MTIPIRSSALGYAVAVVLALLAAGVHGLTQGLWGESVPRLLFLAAVFATAALTRLGPTLLAVALGGLAVAYWTFPPAGAWSAASSEAWAGLTFFGWFGSGIAVWAAWSRRKTAQMEQECERHAVTLSSLTEGVIVADPHGRITFLNAAAEHLTGWKRAEAQGQPLTSVFRTLDKRPGGAAALPLDESLCRGDPVGPRNETLLITKDGSRRPIDEQTAPVRDREGRMAGVVLVFRDATQRRATQMAQSRLAALVDSSDDAILGQTFEGVVTDWNAGAERLFGFTAEETVGQSLFSTIVPPDRKEELLTVLRRVQRGERIEQFETVRRCKDGRRIPVGVRISPIRDAEGEVVGASAIDRDISRRRAAEQRRNARLAVTQILAHQKDIDTAIAEVLGAVGSALAWDVGCLWRLHPEQGVLRCQEFWQQPSRDVEAFRAATMRLAFGPGHLGPDQGLPGRVWESGRAIWIADVVRDAELRRAPRAEEVGLHGGFACPISVADQFLGVVEWFSGEIQQPDEDLLEMMATIGGQIAQFIERREAEQSLCRREQELSDFFDNAAVGLHWVGPEGTILRVNQAELDMLGYRREEYLRHHIAEFHADPPVIEDILQCLTSGEELRGCEARLRCKDGSIKHVLIDSNVLWEDGRFVHTRCFTRDITERKRAEAALHESEERLRMALEAGRMGAWQWEIPTGKVIWSPTLEAIHGFPAGSFPGTFEAFQRDIHPEDRQRVVEKIRQSLEEGQEHYLEYRIVCPDGSVRWLEARGRLFCDDAGEPARLTGVCSDVTNRKRLEQSLRFLSEASKSLSVLVDYRSTLQKMAHLAVPDFADWCAVDMLDDHGELQRLAVAHVDPSKVVLAEDLSRRYRAAPDAPHGPRRVLRTGEPELISEIDESMLDRLAQDEEHRQVLRQLGLKSAICVPLMAAERTLGAITFVLAESGRRYRPEDLAMVEELARRAVIAIENARLYQQVREADRRKDEFLAMLAHELRNPLAPIRSGLDLLAMEDGPHRDTLAVMQEQVEHVVRLVDDLLDVSRIMRGKIELRIEPVRLSKLIRRSVEAVRGLVDGQHQELVVEAPEQPIWLEADPVRVVQVIENLLNNASKYTDSGGRIELHAERQGSEAVIRVRDTGIGIEPELLPSIFQLFTQSSRSLDRAQGGLGIGLTLVHRLVDLHGGTVSVDSDGVGHGSTFTVRLPVAEEPTGAEQAETEPEDARCLRILVVDDNVGAAQLLAKLIASLADHHVDIAHAGPAALAKIQQTRPEIVFLDIGLPGMDGYHVAREVRRDRQLDRVRLIALTGYGQQEDRQMSKEAGFDEHLVKPPSVEQIAEILRGAQRAD